MRVRDKQIAMTPELHHKVSIAAAYDGVTIKKWLEAAARRALDGNGKRLVDSKPDYDAWAAERPQNRR